MKRPLRTIHLLIFFLSVVFAILVVYAGVQYFVVDGEEATVITTLPAGQGILNLGEHELIVEIADTDISRTQGLSGRTEIGADGMLFIFPQDTQPGFWMKDMQFDLDFIWIKDGKVVQVMTDIPKPDPGQPLTSLPTYMPDQLIDSMLEVPAGFVEQYQIQVGDQAVLRR